MDSNEKIDILQGLVKTMAELGLSESKTIRALRTERAELLIALRKAEFHHQGNKSEIGCFLREIIEKAESKKSD